MGFCNLWNQPLNIIFWRCQRWERRRASCLGECSMMGEPKSQSYVSEQDYHMLYSTIALKKSWNSHQEPHSRWTHAGTSNHTTVSTHSVDELILSWSNGKWVLWAQYEGEGCRWRARPCYLRGTIIPEGASDDWLNMGWLESMTHLEWSELGGRGVEVVGDLSPNELFGPGVLPLKLMVMWEQGRWGTRKGWIWPWEGWLGSLNLAHRE